MKPEQKLDKIISDISRLGEQVTLIQAILLEMSHPRSADGRRQIRTMQVVLDGCEDQTIEPSDDAGDDGDAGDEEIKRAGGKAPGLVKAKNPAKKAVRKKKLG